MRNRILLACAAVILFVSTAYADESGGTVSASVNLAGQGDSQVVLTTPAGRPFTLTTFCASPGADILLTGRTFGSIAEIIRGVLDSACYTFPGFPLPRNEALTCRVITDFSGGFHPHFCSVAGTVGESH